MHTLYRVLLGLHVVFGVFGLAAFWVPVLARKGGRTHVRAGRIFLWSAYVVAGSAVAIALMDLLVPFRAHPEELPADPARIAAAAAALRGIGAFLGYLGIVTLAFVHHGVRAMQAKRSPERIRTPFHTALNGLACAAGAVSLVLGIATGQLIYALLSPVGLLTGRANLRFARRPPAEHMAHWYQHMGAMIGAGIAFHTAFAVFGGARLLGLGGLEGPWAFVPWVLPGIVGGVATALWTRHYRRKFERGSRRELAAPGGGGSRERRRVVI